MDATKTLPPRPGSTLHNGSTVIATVDAGPRRYVLGLLPGNTTAAYATWEMDDQEATFWGHYFGRSDAPDNFFQAVVDLRLRAGLELPRYGP